MPNIEELLSSKEPLGRNVALSLAAYNEEDDRVDFKENFDPSSEKDWLEITKDASAFANTHGGYLVFGISDGDKEVVGLSRAVIRVLKDANNISQKVNRNIEPDIVSLRSKEFRIKNKSILILLVPKSAGETHLISKDGSFTYRSGKTKVVLRKGTFYVRRSASNHLGDSQDLKYVIERRIDQFRESLIDKVARVVNSPKASETVIVSKDATDATGERITILDSSETLPLGGKSYRLAPEGDEFEIATWSDLHRSNPHLKPPPELVWRWYANRGNIDIRDQHKLDVFQFSLWNNAPNFYWIKGMKSQLIKAALLNALRKRPSSICLTPILTTASFLGKKFYNKMLAETGDHKRNIAPAMQKFPQAGPRERFGNFPLRAKETPTQLKKKKLAILNKTAETTLRAGRKPGVNKAWQAQKIDCFLYAQDDQYV